MHCIGLDVTKKRMPVRYYTVTHCGMGRGLPPYQVCMRPKVDEQTASLMPHGTKQKKSNEETKNKNPEMLRRNSPVIKYVESVLRPEGKELTVCVQCAS